LLNVGPAELMIILVLALLVLGPKKLPEVSRQIGKGIREFRRVSDEVRGEVEHAMTLDDDEPEQAMTLDGQSEHETVPLPEQSPPGQSPNGNASASVKDEPHAGTAELAEGQPPPERTD
jgi:Tat protein translocase TatB subunit